MKQKPGKPLFFGASTPGEKLLFGLPGNPASVLVSFYEYVRPAIWKSMGATGLPGKVVARAALRNDIVKPSGLTHFLKGRLHEDGSVEVLENQGSHMMASFARANCLVVVDEAVTNLGKGEQVKVHLLPA